MIITNPQKNFQSIELETINNHINLMMILKKAKKKINAAIFATDMVTLQMNAS